MFFIFSKVLAFLIKPLNWICGLLLYLFFTKNKKRKKIAFKLLIGFALFFSNPFFSNLALRVWEVPPTLNSQLQDTFDIAIVLGGYTLNMQPYDRAHFTDRSERLTNTLELYHQGKVKKILLSGGSSSILYKEREEAATMGAFLERMNIPKADFIIEKNSRNTRENAIYSAEIIRKKYPNSKCLLVTSAFHMRRSIACFEKVKLDYTPYSVDIDGKPFKLSFSDLLEPNPMSLLHWQLLIKEWVGYLVYKLKGYA